jgi:diaminopimelate epimerase
MHGLGNDFIVFDAPPGGPPSPEILRRLADRHTGIGFDQALMLEKPRRDGTVVYYRIFNADGDEVEQCGNGARCIASIVSARLGRGPGMLVMDSPGGLVRAKVREDGLVSVAMGVPNFAPASLPFEASGEASVYPLNVGDSVVEIGAVSIGNPHAVIRVPSVVEAPVDRLGPAIENHARFPKRTNVGFMEVLAPDHIRLRVHERGTGETRASRAAGRGGQGGPAGRPADGAMEGPGRADLADGTRGKSVRGEDRAMTKSAATAGTAILDDASVSGYLEAFPEFFERNPQLLQRIRLPDARGGGSTVSLLEKQVDVLRERNRLLERKLAEFIDVARGNDELAAKIHRLTTRLVHARGFGRVVDAVEASLREDFDVQRAVLVLFREDAALAARESPFIRLAERQGADMRSFETLFAGDKPRCGQVRDSQRDYLFGEGVVDVGSVALVPLGPGGNLGLLACGATDSQRFNPTVSTDFLARIGELIAAALVAD